MLTSKIIIIVDFINVVVSLDLARSQAWNSLKHFYHNFIIESLNRIKKIINNNKEKNILKIKKLVLKVVQIFEFLIFKIIIRRYNKSR